MAYISTSHGVGDTVYAYCLQTDSVARLRVVSIQAASEDASQYGGGKWAVSYWTTPANLPGQPATRYSEADLHSSARDAFPELVLAAEPEMEAA